MSEAGVGSTPAAAPAPAPAGLGSSQLAGQADSALAASYGPACQRLRAGGASRAVAFDRCLEAMARLAGGETGSPVEACRVESRAPGGARALCLAAGRSLLRRLAGHRLAES
jgi:hypothetical protein